MKTECLVIGDLNIDLIFYKMAGFPSLGKEILAEDYAMVIGGSGGLFTAILSKLGIKTAIISKIGHDTYGSFLQEELKDRGADISRLLISKTGRTGITISLSYEKDKSQISSLGIIKNMKGKEVHPVDLRSLRHVHFSSYYMMDGLKDSYIDIIKDIESKNKDITFSFDTNDDPRDEWGPKIYDILKYIDILFLNKKEAIKISKKPDIEQAVDKLSEYVPKVVIKLGRDGHYAKIDGITYRGHCKNINNENFLDGTGSGDNFDAAFVYGFLSGFDLKKMLGFANFCAEKSIEYLGGVGNDEKFVYIKRAYNLK